MPHRLSPLPGMALVFILFLAGSLAALEVEGISHETIPGYKTLTLSAENVEAFKQRLQRERDDLFRSLEKKYEGNQEKIAGNTALWAFDRLLAAVQPIQLEVQEGEAGPDLAREFLQLQRIHYGVLSDIGKRPSGLPFLSATLFSVLKSAAHVAAGPLLLEIPNEYRPESPIGGWKARSEAGNLHDSRGQGPLTREALAGMTPLEISRLQPPADNPLIDGVPAGSRFAEYLASVQQAVRAVDPRYARFEFRHARRIVFLDEIKAEATSPKITVKDRYGLKWKMKWGDEVHTDVVAGRLYINLGARYTDPKFYSGPGETILILASAKGGEIKGLKTFSQLRDGIYKAFFKFRLEDWILPAPLRRDAAGNILGTGIVDAAMAEREDLDRACIGAWYVTFKECQMSLYNPACKRLGATPLSSLDAPRDRIQRGLMLFNLWINNVDVKDDNTRMAYLYNPRSREFDRFVEFQSDNGATFGKLVGIGKVNYFRDRWLMESPFGIHFHLRPMFVPRAWKACTWADARWMALRICSLSREDLAESLADSGWPTFVQQVMVEKLLARRNQLIPVFRLDRDGVREIPCNPRLNIGAGQPLVRNGDLDKNSPLLRKLVQEFHPEGFTGIRIRIFN